MTPMLYTITSHEDFSNEPAWTYSTHSLTVYSTLDFLTHTHTYARTCTPTYARTRTHMHTHAHTRAQHTEDKARWGSVKLTHTPAQARTHTHAHTRTHTHA